jgi:hypothetical protein
MNDFTQSHRDAISDQTAAELDQWRRFVHLLLLLVQSGRLDPEDGMALVEALGHPPDVARGRRVLFEIVRRHEPEIPLGSDPREKIATNR